MNRTACALLLALIACDPEPTGRCDDVSSCLIPFVVVDPPTFELDTASVSEVTMQNIGVGLLRVRDARLIAESADAFTIDFAVVPFDSPAEGWTPIHAGKIEVPRLHSLVWRVSAQAEVDGELIMRTNDPVAPEIIIPIHVSNP